MDLNLTDLSEFWLSYVYQYPEIAGGIILFCVALAWFSLLGKGVKKMVTPGQKKMSVQQREVLEDALEYAFDEATLNGTMSVKSARYWRNKLATDYGLNGLAFRSKVFKKLHRFKAEKLKEDIKRRLANGLYSSVAKLPEDGPITQGRLSTQDKFRAKFLKTA